MVTAFLKRDDSILLLKRSDEVKTFKGRWAGVSGYLEKDDPVKQARTEIKEETKLEGKLLSEGKIVSTRDGDKIWNVHPFLFEVEDEPELDWENERYEWVLPDKIKDRKTVPELWEAYISARCSDED
ncbi:MAG: NUDIX domain-containing protein [Candidatus Thermoplasmatota archaeon]